MKIAPLGKNDCGENHQGGSQHTSEMGIGAAFQFTSYDTQKSVLLIQQCLCSTVQQNFSYFILLQIILINKAEEMTRFC